MPLTTTRQEDGYIISKVKTKVLITGWYSFESPHNTAGDLLACQVLTEWLTRAGFDYDIGVVSPKEATQVSITLVNPQDYIAIIFICGPITTGHVKPLMSRFKDIKRIALNVSIVSSSDLSKDFDVIIARDSLNEINPDIVLLSKKKTVPVVGLIYAGGQKEYPNQRHDIVEEIVKVVLKSHDIAVVNIDTKLPFNEYGLRSVDQIESLIKKMDVIITTRLHGAILSIKNYVPVIMIDSVPGGAKVSYQSSVLKWPITCQVDKLTHEWLNDALNNALTNDMDKFLSDSNHLGLSLLKHVEQRFLNALNVIEWTDNA